MFLSHELTDETLEAIARAFDKKDHTTVMHACEKIRKLGGKDADLDQALPVLRSRIRAVVEDK
jgi:chromosomal replication initiator protein